MNGPTCERGAGGSGMGVGGSHNNGGPEICVEVCDRLANGGRIEESEDFHETRDPQHSARARESA